MHVAREDDRDAVDVRVAVTIIPERGPDAGVVGVIRRPIAVVVRAIADLDRAGVHVLVGVVAVVAAVGFGVVAVAVVVDRLGSAVGTNAAIEVEGSVRVAAREGEDEAEKRAS